MSEVTPNGVTLDAPKHITSLRTAAILVSVDMHMWTGTKSDARVADDVSANMGKAIGRVGKWTHDLLANDSHLKAVLNFRQTIHNWLKRTTYDWAGSLRLLPAARIESFLAEYAVHETTFNRLLDDFLAHYNDKVAAQAFTRGEFFKRSDYPTEAELRERFSMRLYTAEVPEADFRTQVSIDLADDLKKNYERQVDTMLRDIHQQQVDQLVSVMTSISHCCELEEVTGKDGVPKTRRRKIYDSTIQKAIELCDTFSQFNLANDPALEEARSNLYRVLRGVDVAALRESDSQRHEIKQEVDDILKKFGGGLGA
jgi:hypothetical protein